MMPPPAMRSNWQICDARRSNLAMLFTSARRRAGQHWDEIQKGKLRDVADESPPSQQVLSWLNCDDDHRMNMPAQAINAAAYLIGGEDHDAALKFPATAVASADDL